MSDDRSLTECSSTDSTAHGESDESSVEPATVTYRWQSDGVLCNRCGTSSKTQWFDKGEFVCPDCKSWT